MKIELIFSVQKHEGTVIAKLERRPQETLEFKLKDKWKLVQLSLQQTYLKKGNVC